MSSHLQGNRLGCKETSPCMRFAKSQEGRNQDFERPKHHIQKGCPKGEESYATSISLHLTEKKIAEVLEVGKVGEKVQLHPRRGKNDNISGEEEASLGGQKGERKKKAFEGLISYRRYNS